LSRAVNLPAWQMPEESADVRVMFLVMWRSWCLFDEKSTQALNYITAAFETEKGLSLFLFLKAEGKRTSEDVNARIIGRWLKH
jgi:hypothetical protein